MAAIGAIINGRYKIEQQLGSGGMSTVYMARDMKLNIIYAIKEIKKTSDNELVTNTSMNEVNLLKGLNNNHIPRIIDIIEDEYNVFVIQEYVQGISLEQYLEAEKHFNQELVVEWMKQMCNVLEYLHSKNIIHRDIKPGNIMYTPTSSDGNEAGHITLIDFGIGRTYKKGKTKDTVNYLTEAFAAPEQKKQIGQSNPRTDIFSLGLTMYTLLTGIYPDETIEIKPITEIDSFLSTGLEKIVLKCIKENPDERYQSCLELLYDLEHYKESEDLYLNNQKKKIVRFAGSSILFIFFVLLAIVLNITVKSMESKNYGLILDKATNEEEIENAISINTGNTRGYEILWNTYIEDGIISDEELTEINRLLVDNRSSFKDMEAFASLNYTIAQDIWFNYGGTQESIESGKYVNDSIKSTKAKPFFETAVEYADEGSSYYNDANSYLVWNDYIQAAASTQKNGKKLDEEVLINGWRALSKLLTSIENSAEPIVQMKMCSQVLSSISINLYRYKSAGVSKGDIMLAIGDVETIVSSITDESIMDNELCIELKKSVSESLPNVTAAVNEAFKEAEQY